MENLRLTFKMAPQLYLLANVELLHSLSFNEESKSRMPHDSDSRVFEQWLRPALTPND